MASVFRLGLTGGIGSGKSTVAGILVELGAAVIDADAIAHAVTATGGPAIEAIRATFGNNMITPEGALDRQKMRALAFSHPHARQQLEAIVQAMAAAEQMDAFNRLDTEFHVLIARAGQNQLIADLTVAVRQAVREAIRDASDALPDWPRFRVQLSREHRAILDAITTGEATAAASLMEAHIRGAYAVLGIPSGPH